MTEEQTQEGQEPSPLKGDEKDLQRLASWLGRVEKNYKDQETKFTELMGKIENLSEQKNRPQFGDDEQAKFNEKLHSMILDGNVMEALTLVNKVNDEAKRRIKDADKKRLETAFSAIAEDPLMKNEDVSKKIRDMADTLVQQGMDPKVAVSHAKTSVENETLRSMIASGQNVNLDMLGSGGPKAPLTPDKKLPGNFEKAYLAGKEKGYFKDRQDYINSLDPRVRAELGLDA